MECGDVFKVKKFGIVIDILSYIVAQAEFLSFFPGEEYFGPRNPLGPDFSQYPVFGRREKIR